tara:strand:+ start:6131 stop:6799 length:669 start_codon:yes stop_codon:yes gene_type:complete
MDNSQDRVDILNLLNLIINRDVSNNTFTHDLIDNSNNTLHQTSRFFNYMNRTQNELPFLFRQNNRWGMRRMRRILENSLHQKNKYKNVISEKGKSKIKLIKYKSEKEEIKSCPIMFIDFEENEEVAKLPCGHIFNKDGIMQWLEEESNKCPVCRYELESKEIEAEKSENVQTTYHPYGPHNRRVGFHSFLDRYYEAQEQNMIQRAIEESLLDNNLPDDSDDN